MTHGLLIVTTTPFLDDYVDSKTTWSHALFLCHSTRPTPDSETYQSRITISSLFLRSYKNRECPRLISPLDVLNKRKTIFHSLPSLQGNEHESLPPQPLEAPPEISTCFTMHNLCTQIFTSLWVLFWLAYAYIQCRKAILIGKKTGSLEVQLEHGQLDQETFRHQWQQEIDQSWMLKVMVALAMKLKLYPTVEQICGRYQTLDKVNGDGLDKGMRFEDEEGDGFEKADMFA